MHGSAKPRARPLWWHVALGGTLMVTACAQVLGLGDYSIESESSAGSGGEEPSAGGAGGSTGGTPLGGSAGTATTVGGTAGEAGTGGEGGVGGSVSTLLGCNGERFEISPDVIRSCILKYSCSPFVPNVRISTCITLNTQRAFTGAGCTATAESCDDVETCNGDGFAGDLCLGEVGMRCQDNLAIDCDSGIFFDCDKYGGICDVSIGSASTPCRVVDSCDESTGEAACSGDFIYDCLNGQGYGHDCSSFGARCEQVPDGAGCFYAAPSCNGSEPPCAGNNLQLCDEGDLLRFDCGSVGLSCVAETDLGSECLAPGCSVADLDGCVESCTGSSINLCYGGVPFSVDCREHGFSTCTEYMADALGDYATCE